MSEEKKDALTETVETAINTARTIQGAIKTGKAIAGVAKGAAVGGPLGAVFALQHHEKPMGNGYAAVTHIHSYARLIAIADVFDALFSARSYKDKWSLGDVIDYMRSNVHKEFDAVYLDAFLRALDEILELYKRESLPPK